MLKPLESKITILYLSYDGMTDPLGQSQVLPYVAGLSRLGYHFTLISFEKPERYAKNEIAIRSFCAQNNIMWVPLRYTKYPPVLSTLIDIARMWQTAVRLHTQNSFAIVHCRSYLSSLVGLHFRRRHKARFIFDMRGFWADERVEGGIWRLNNPLFKLIYSFFKRKEITFVKDADAIISLTHAGKKTIEDWPVYKNREQKPPFEVIPCSVDFNRFLPQATQVKLTARALLGIEKDTLVVSYVGSLGTWYMLKEMLQLYSKIRIKQPKIVFLFFTGEPPEIILNEAKHYGIPKEEILVKYASHAKLPGLLCASNVSLCFIKPSFSKRASSPTKLGELLAMGIPTYCNRGVGDVAENIDATGGGLVLQGFSDEDLEEAVLALPDMLQKDGELIRNKAQSIFSIELAIASYANVYKKILEPNDK